jgi:hypothetical protein
MTAERRRKPPSRVTIARIKAEGLACIDRRTAASRALMQWRREILASLGGESNLSAMELTVVEQAARNRLLLDSIDAWLLSQPSLINRRRKSLLPLVAQRMSVDAALTRTLTTLGLKRREREVTLQDYLNSQEHETALAQAADDEPTSPQPPESQESATGSDQCAGDGDKQP